ncbi:MAG: 23S rRNA (adenine(2503)-C(2))-methyltransferase RlmN [Zetaproteobacteria bacterium]|nr:MAG: 23S rRNA (adenine(2503)-C(2))-methyltransferase RlmN [Zetaproteobacteria bacterium]
MRPAGGAAPLSVCDLTPDLLHGLCARAGARPVHAERLHAWLFRRGRADLTRLPDLPRALRERLGEWVDMRLPRPISRCRAGDGTAKYLLSFADGAEVETVLIPAARRLTQCVSTQAGCALGCRFCRTATAGLRRHLTRGEMVAQLLACWQETGVRPRNLVLMGMGEPMHNYEQVAGFIRLVTDPAGLAFAPRRVTLSTAGVVPGIDRLLADCLPCSLAISLNATTDAVRDRLMPINRKYPIAALLAAMRRFARAFPRRRLLVAYLLIGRVNDSAADAHRLIGLLDGIPCTVNLLPFNPWPGAEWRRPAPDAVDRFRAVLAAAGMVAVVRESRGREIAAACGQLLRVTGAAEAGR